MVAMPETRTTGKLPLCIKAKLGNNFEAFKLVGNGLKEME